MNYGCKEIVVQASVGACWRGLRAIGSLLVGDPHTRADCDGGAYGNPYTIAHVNGYTDAGSHANGYAHSDAHLHAESNGYCHAYPDAHLHAGTNRYSYAYPNAHLYPGADVQVGAHPSM